MNFQVKRLLWVTCWGLKLWICRAFEHFMSGTSVDRNISLIWMQSLKFRLWTPSLNLNWIQIKKKEQEDFNRISLCIDHINTVWPCRKARRCDSYLQIACKNADYLRRKGILWICFYGTIFAKKSNRKSIFPILSDFFRFLDFSRL